MIDPNESANVTLAVLAGGEGSRMGKAKGLLQIGGKPILEYLISRIGWTGPTILVSAPGRENPPGSELFSKEVVDPVAGLGPLRGILTALQHLTTEIVVIIPLDMPAVHQEQLTWYTTQLRQRHDKLGLMGWRLDKTEERIEPFPCALRKSAESAVRDALNEQRQSVHGLSKDSRFAVVDVPESWPDEVWINLNSPEDVQRYKSQ